MDEAAIRISIDDEGGGVGPTRGGVRGGTDRMIQGMSEFGGQTDEVTRGMTEAAGRWRETYGYADKMITRLSEFSKMEPPTHWMADRMAQSQQFDFTRQYPVADMMGREMEDFRQEMEKLQMSLHPGVIRERVRMEAELADLQQQYNNALEESRKTLEESSFIGPRQPEFAVPLIDLEAEAKKFADAMLDLEAAMDPDVVQQRVKQEIELAEARQELERRMEAERQKQAPTVASIPHAYEDEKEGGGALKFLQSIRGTIGGMGRFGKLAGIGLDISKAGGLGSMGGGAGIAGAVLEGFKAVGQMDAGFKKAAGNFTASMISADADVTRTASNLSQSVSSAGDALLMIVPPAGLFVKSVGAMGEALTAVTQQIDGMVDRYAQVNPDIMQAQMVADMRQFLGDVRRGQEAAPALMSYIQQRAEIQQRFEDTKIRILNRIMPLVQSGMNAFDKLLPLIEGIFGLLSTVARLLPGAQNQDVMQDIRQLLQDSQGAELPAQVIRQGYPFQQSRETQRSVYPD